MANIYALSVATKTEGYLDFLRQGLEKNDIPFKIIGFGEEWKGWLWRAEILLEHLKTNNYYDDDIILIVDSYDVLFAGDKKTLIEKFLSFDTDIVFGVHYSKSTKSKRRKLARLIMNYCCRKTFKTSRELVINGGSIIGRKSNLVILYENLIEHMSKSTHKDDQISLNNISLAGINYKEDIYSEIFYIWDTVSIYEGVYYFLNDYFPENSENLVDGRITLDTDVTPEVIHGVGHRNMNNLIEKSSDNNLFQRDFADGPCPKNNKYREKIKIFLILSSIFSIVVIIVAIYFFIRDV